MVRVLFRTDASTLIGTGHVMRCLTLAKALKERGAECAFIGREHPGHMLDLIEKEGFTCHCLSASQPSSMFGHILDNDISGYASWLGVTTEQDVNDCLQIIKQSQPDWLVVDHYALDLSWEQRLRPNVGKLMVIDDLANRSHDCDVLLDQNLGSKAVDYLGKVPASCKVLTGPDFALLRPEFAAHREISLTRRKIAQSLTHILVTMGGVDAGNATGTVLDALAKSHLPKGCRISVVMGEKAPWLQKVQAQAADMPYQTDVLSGISNMAEVMASADLAIGAAGSTSWERCCLGLPSVMVVLAENQALIAQALNRTGSAIALPMDSIQHGLPKIVARLHKEPDLLSAMSSAAAQVTDGQGVQIVLRWLQ